jgi:polyhydroxyalkanoate synthase subunit PhaC
VTEGAAPPRKTTARTARARAARIRLAEAQPPAEPENPTTTGAADAVVGTDPVGIPSFADAAGDLASALASGAALNRMGRKLALESVRILLGSTSVAPDKKDWRFTDPTWTENPFYRRLAQAYLASCNSLDELLDEFERAGRSSDKARFLLNILESAAAPTNTLLGNPAALKRSLETAGMSLLRGTKNYLEDLRHNGGMPATVDRTAFEVGRDLAVTPGAVVDRDSYAELIQYTPTTETVHARPILIVPPPIGRYYFLDLRPGRSFIEYAVSRGLQVFIVSWRNPGKEQRDWDLDTYARRVLSAIDTVREITGSPDVNTIGFCAGGILMTLALNHLAALGDDRVHSASYAVTLLDFGVTAPIAAFSSPKLLAFARWNSGRSGVISARDMGKAFTWMRPNDLVWNYWVNNYLMGNKPPVFDILAWNADGTNLPAALHRQFLDMFQDNVLAKPGGMSVLGTPVDLKRITLPTFVTGGTTDHLTPWTGCYRTTQLLGGPSTFVLSNAGHIQSLVNPPGNAKATYFSGGQPVADPNGWLTNAEKHPGTWWTFWADWVSERSSKSVPAPSSLGSAEHPVLDAAPGLFVRDLVPAGL